MRVYAPFVLAALLAGCTTATERSLPVSPTIIVRPTAPELNPPARLAGDVVIGNTAAALLSMFGAPALDVQEGNARKLQFSSDACVLDAYLYPSGGRGEAVATYVDARRPDGADTSPAACAEALRRR